MQKAGGQGDAALAVQIAAARAGEEQPLPRAGDGDVQEPPLLFQLVVVVGGAGDGEDVLLHADHEHHLELQPLDRMDGGEGDVVALVHVVGVRAERDLVEEIGEGRALVHAAELVDGVDKLVDVRLFVDALVRIVGVHGEDAAVVDDVADELVGALLRALDDQLFEEGAEGAHLLLAARVEGELVHVQHGVVHGEVVFGGVLFEHLDGARADAALGHVDDAGDRLAVEGVVDDAQVGEQVLDLLALVEAEAAEHLVRDAVFGKFLLVRAGERVDAHEHGEVGKAVALRA